MKTLLVSFALIAAWHPGFAQMQFKVIPGHADTKAQFTSEAPMETVKGITHAATGYLELDPSGSGDGAQGEIHVDLGSLKTGLDLRDRHMRENHLETSKYPEALFTLTSLILPPGGLPEGARTRVSLKGLLKMHGVEKTIEPETYLTMRHDTAGSSLQIEAEFTVRLADYQIKRPQFLLMRLAEEQHVRVELHAVAGNDMAAGTP